MVGNIVDPFARDVFFISSFLLYLTSTIACSCSCFSSSMLGFWMFLLWLGLVHGLVIVFLQWEFCVHRSGSWAVDNLGWVVFSSLVLGLPLG